MLRDSDWLADLGRIEGRASFLREQSLLAIWVYRFGRRLDQRPSGLRKALLTRLYWLLFHLSETVTGVSLPKACEIGPGLRIWHFGNIFLHPAAKLGANCTLRQGVTIGNRYGADDAPIIGDSVEFGSYAQALGRIHIGSRAKIGAMTLVLTDVPADGTAVGVPARILPARQCH
jgi:serine O-acetyltransferase